MSTEIPSLDSIFCSAIEIAAEKERAAYVARACGDDAKLKRQVEKLVAAHFQAGNFLERLSDAPAGSGAYPPGPTDEPTGANQAENREGVGTIIGPYKLLQQIGEGGMGTVWMAEQQEPVRRLVALKVIKAGMDSAHVVARFEAERQALALMDHPNIAKVLDGGTTANGRPFFVMELVKGTPLTVYCDEHRLTPRERLELFVPVCQAIQHAHQKGIIHRDVKPSNVLVAPYDGKPVVKVIDFGVAKAAGQRLTERTLFTGYGAVIGTLEYMSPEQAELNNQDIDTRSDVYSLGAILYELLTGTTPLTKQRSKQSAFTEVLRLIREEEPPKPSKRLSESKESRLAISAQRRTEPAKLTKLVRGELDWIVMKALEKDRNRRYETASALAADLQRYLHDDPVLACPPSAWCRFCKFARRKKAILATATAVAVAIVVTVGSLISAVMVLADSNAQTREEQQRTEAALERETQAKEEMLRALYFQRIALAERELSHRKVGRAERLLDGCPEHLRGWEWHYLKRRRYGALPPLQHAHAVHGIAFSPDGRYLASGTADGTVHIWHLSTRAESWSGDHAPARELRTLKGHKARVAAYPLRHFLLWGGHLAPRPYGSWTATVLDPLSLPNGQKPSVPLHERPRNAA